jgi:hypothetical protein
MTIADVISWKYGAIADTVDGKITAWRHPSIPQPDEAQLAADTQEYIAYQAANLYKEKRRAEYPPIGDGLDAMVKAQNGDPKPLADYVAKCLAVKAKYPKPGANS